jgi:ADP-heptose:LPS heptosyltransferase
MGYGDAIMATALARGFHAQGKRAAFGDGRTIKWTGYCEDIFANNPNIARPGEEGQNNLVWFPHYKKHLTYAKFDGRHWVWDYKFKAVPGEFFFAPGERLPLPVQNKFIVIEPNVAWQRAANINKDWGDKKYEFLADLLMRRGHTVVQFIHNNSVRRLAGVHQLPTKTFRQAAAIMASASVIIAPEGANHHAAAALGVPAVIVWGGFSPPQTMGYANQIMLTGGVRKACGSTYACKHCREAMDNISIDDVRQAAEQFL